MDDIVKKAMAKWPDVPDCYGWLALDARGNWRMRDERAQHLNLPGDKVVQAALLGFINRNYLADRCGRWFFQNGPQRVFVNLEATPFIARTDPAHGLVLHTGEPVASLRRAWMTENGELIVDSAGKIAQVDDRDVAQLMAALEIDGRRASDEALTEWLDGGPGRLALAYQGQATPVKRIAHDQVAAQLQFIRLPAPSDVDLGTDPAPAP